MPIIPQPIHLEDHMEYMALLVMPLMAIIMEYMG